MLEELLLFAQQAPRLFTPYDFLMFVSRLLHILSAIVLVGGLFYLWAVVTPAAATGATAPVDQYFGGRRAAWAKWIGITSLFLLVTGLWNFIQMVKTNEIATSYHMIGGVKILIGLALMFLAALLAGRTSAADAVRRKWRTWLSLCLAIGVITVALGTVMRTYPRSPKLDADKGPQLIAPAP